jgi:hypothetical protein
MCTRTVGSNSTLSASKQKALFLQGLFVWVRKSLGAQIGTHEAPMRLPHYLLLLPVRHVALSPTGAR